jgi:hypothetical protein
MNAKKIFRTFIVLLIAGFGIYFYYHFYWQFGSGTKAGTLNTFMKKGYLFKTYEGKIIQSGFKANVQSNEFNFSVTKESVAQILLNNAGRDVEVHYIEYFGALPWRGMERYIVDSVYQVRGEDGNDGLNPK